jgi:hypothetical protein
MYPNLAHKFPFLFDPFTRTYVTKLIEKENVRSVTELANLGHQVRATTTARKEENNKVSTRRIDVDVVLHASTSYYRCCLGVLQVLFLPTSLKKHVDDVSRKRILDQTMNRICELSLTSFHVAFQ